MEVNVSPIIACTHFYPTENKKNTIKCKTEQQYLTPLYLWCDPYASWSAYELD